MRNNELKEKLRPIDAIDLRRPRRQRIALEKFEQAAAPERPVDDNAKITLGGQRQKPAPRP